MHPSTPPAGRVMSNQIQVTNNGRVQTFATVETADGVTVLSTGGGLADSALHIPFAARAWLARVISSDDRAKAEAAFRERMKLPHPDMGGAHAHAAALTAAITRARETLR